MASRKRPADWSAALSHERIARAEAVGERLAAEQQLEELQEQLAGVEAEREGLESQLTALGAEREAHAELERDLEDALEELRDTEELTASLQAELDALRGGESAHSRPPPPAAAWPRCRHQSPTRSSREQPPPRRPGAPSARRTCPWAAATAASVACGRPAARRSPSPRSSA